MSTYVVAGSRPWNRAVFERRLRSLEGTWHFVTTDDELRSVLAREEAVEAVFFLHWSQKVGDDILDAHRCVNFHMTALPYGRGGSPLQNLISRGHDHTTLTALAMTAAFDAGPIYAQRELCLRGTAEEIFVRAGERSADIIEELVGAWPEPVAQQGEVTVFRRRTPADSRIEGLSGLDALHDFVRMLDAEGYPQAFLEHEGFRFEFRRSARYGDRVEASVTITPVQESP